MRGDLNKPTRQTPEDERLQIEVDYEPIIDRILATLRGETRYTSVELVQYEPKDVLVWSVTVTAKCLTNRDMVEIEGDVALASPPVVERVESGEAPPLIKGLAKLWSGRATVATTGNAFVLDVVGTDTRLHAAFHVWQMEAEAANKLRLQTDQLHIDPESPGARETLKSILVDYSEILAQLLSLYYDIRGVEPGLSAKKLAFRVPKDRGGSDEGEFIPGWDDDDDGGEGGEGVVLGPKQ